MSLSPAQPVRNAPTGPRGQAAAAATKKRGCGCLGSVFGLIVLGVLLLVLLNPWSLHMGGRWTPALTWHGVGTLHSTTGATYGFYMELWPYMSRSVRGGGGYYGGHQNMEGSAKICTPQGSIYPMTVRGYLKNTWIDAGGKPITFYLRSLKGAPTKLNVDLYGSWQGQELALEDKGNMAMSFSADGNAKGYLDGVNAPSENTSGRLRYAMESDFASVCVQKGKGGL
jgi:hypothetical protein